ncbi:MAG: glycerol-3-phosphate responsive antiterminator [Eubacterium sp.]|nr:glycerol-3-phosphate responsive antiterminator [Eubacterium sp.]MDD7210563.1 glycerol-3-phosphate responsive antiterminator [Lachnospiraceae bacterium]MDY5498307.1 glycerol-3-phosphate responsive antiterminator [Anaerobutyricum sp.]
MKEERYQGGEFQIIPSVRELKNLDTALNNHSGYVLLSECHIGNLRQLVHTCHSRGQKVVVNHELVGGLGNDKAAFQMLKNLYHVDMVIASSVSKLHILQKMNMKTIFRISLIDSISVDNALRMMKEVNCSAVELRPYYHAMEFLPKFQDLFDGEFFVAGFVNSKEKLMNCKEAGFQGTMTSTKELWELKI